MSFVLPAWQLGYSILCAGRAQLSLELGDVGSAQDRYACVHSAHLLSFTITKSDRPIFSPAHSY